MKDQRARIRRSGSGRLRPPIVPVVLGAGLAWAYWPILAAMARRWAEDPRYSHGYLVPMFAAALLWLRRRRLDTPGPRPSAWGIPLVAAGAALRLAGAYIYLEWLEAISLLPVIAGLCVLLGGRTALGWAWPSIAFLAFMVPLPHRLEMALGWPLQRIATIASTYTLQTIGLAAVGEGNIITMDSAQIGVAEACNGLSMMILFVALSTGVAILVRRHWVEKLLIVASALPIALVANIARITITGVLHETVGERVANIVFHDVAGWIMMPIALALLGLELWIVPWLFPEAEPEGWRPSSLDPAIAPGGPEVETRAPRGGERGPAIRGVAQRM